MSQPSPSPSALRVSELSQSNPTPFALRPDTKARKSLAAELDILGLRKLSFEGTVEPTGDADWQLRGYLGATVVQPCAVTLDPVITRIDTPVTRVFLFDYEEDTAPESEMPEDDTTERLASWIDLHAILREALILNLPLYPRAPDTAPADMRVTEPGVTPLSDEDTRPLAGLAALRDQMFKDPPTDTD